MALLLRPLLRTAALASLADDGRTPPGDAPMVGVDGRDPDRVLLIGSGPVSGTGVASHTEALPGALARALSAQTGRGAVVEARGRRQARLADVADLLAGARLQRFDALVLVVGLFDAVDGCGTRTWRTALHRRLDAMQRDGARDAVVLLTRIPPFSSVVVRRGPVVPLVDRDVVRLNRVLERVAAERAATGWAVLPTPSGDEPVGSAAWYRRCGEALADAVAPLLAAQRVR